MRDHRRPDGRRHPAVGDDAWAIGAVMVAALCCLAPLLIAGGVFGALRGLLPVTLILPAAVVLLLVGATVWFRPRRGRQGVRR